MNPKCQSSDFWYVGEKKGVGQKWGWQVRAAVPGESGYSVAEATKLFSRPPIPMPVQGAGGSSLASQARLGQCTQGYPSEAQTGVY